MSDPSSPSSLSKSNRRKKTGNGASLSAGYDTLCQQVNVLKAQLQAKDEELFRTKERIEVFQSSAKAFFYAAGTTFAIFICLSNSLTAVAHSVWSDVGDIWAYLWGSLLSVASPWTIFVFGSWLMTFGLYWLYAGILLWFELNRPEKLKRFKIQPLANDPIDRQKVWHSVKVVLANQFFINFPLSLILFPVMKWRGCGMLLPLPSFNRVLLELAVFVACEEIGFYYSHRLLHSRALYGRIHKMHHEWIAPIGAAAIYAHPLEHLIGNLGPLFLGPFLCGSHIAVLWVWLALATLNVVNAHAGVHLPFLGSPEAHDFHHLRFNENFGVFGILDYIHGTDVNFRSSQQFKQHRPFFSLTYKPLMPDKVEKVAAMAPEGETAVQ